MVAEMTRALRTSLLTSDWSVAVTRRPFEAIFTCTPVITNVVRNTRIDVSRIVDTFESWGVRTTVNLEGGIEGSGSGTRVVVRARKPSPQRLMKWASNVCEWSVRFAAAVLVGAAIAWVAGSHPSFTT